MNSIFNQRIKIYKMSTQIDFRTLPANVPVLCIPRVYPNINESRIRKIFDDLNMGTLDRIDIVSKHSDKGEKFNRVFVHFRRWNDSENARVARERLLNGKEIKIIYDDPWFWKISAYREAERKPSAPQNAGQRRATLQIDSDDDRASSARPVTSHRDDRRRDEPRRDEPRRDDRRRFDDRRRDEPRRRRDDSRERPRNDSRNERSYRPRNEPKHQDQEKTKIEPRTPDCSPPRRPADERIESEPMKLDYGDVHLTLPKRKFHSLAKKNLKIEDDKEPGEISTSGDEKEKI